MKTCAQKFLLTIILLLASSGLFAEDCQNEPCKEVPTASGTEQTFKDLSFEEFLQLKNSGQPLVLWDVRNEENYIKGHIPGAKNFPLHLINEKSLAEKTDKDTLIVVYCGSASCPMSRSAATMIKSFGYKVFHYKGGMAEWLEKGHEAEKDPFSGQP